MKVVLAGASMLLIIIIIVVTTLISNFLGYGNVPPGGVRGTDEGAGTWNGYYITSEFGWREHPITGEERYHAGVDLAYPEGSDCPTFMDGTVVETGYDEGGYGNYIVVQDANGNQTVYGHLSSIGVIQGQTVSRGDVIGATGNTGASTGPHLHLEYKDSSGKAQDPTVVLKEL